MLYKPKDGLERRHEYWESDIEEFDVFTAWRYLYGDEIVLDLYHFYAYRLLDGHLLIMESKKTIGKDETFEPYWESSFDVPWKDAAFCLYDSEKIHFFSQEELDRLLE